MARLVPAAVRCLLADRESLTVCLRFPREHWNRVRQSWSGFTMTAGGLRLLADLRRAPHDPPTQLPQRNSENYTETGVAPTDSVARIGAGAQETPVVQRSSNRNFASGLS